MGKLNLVKPFYQDKNKNQPRLIILNGVYF